MFTVICVKRRPSEEHASDTKQNVKTVLWQTRCSLSGRLQAPLTYSANYKPARPTRSTLKSKCWFFCCCCCGVRAFPSVSKLLREQRVSETQMKRRTNIKGDWLVVLPARKHKPGNVVKRHQRLAVCVCARCCRFSTAREDSRGASDKVRLCVVIELIGRILPLSYLPRWLKTLINVFKQGVPV